MNEKMKALVSYNPYDYRYEEVPKPQIQDPNDIIIKVEGCSICAGDVKAYHGGIRIWGTSEEDRYIEAPVIGGHEFFGTIVEAGNAVTNFKIGDRITAEQIAPCGKCEFCRKGEYWMCTESAVYGFKQHIQGGFAEYMRIHPNSIVHKIPDDFTSEQACLIEPIACGMHAVELGDIKHSDTVIISGLGTIGLSMVNLAKLRLPKKIIALDINPNRVKHAKNFGADLCLNPLEDDVQKAVLEVTNGLGCDVYIEASGSNASVNQGLELIRSKGTFVQMGVFADLVTADWNVIGDGKEITIKGSHLSALTFNSVIAGIDAGLIKTDGLISHKFPLSEWKQAFDLLDKAEDDVMKVMLVP